MNSKQSVPFLIVVFVPLFATLTYASEKSGWAMSAGIGSSVIKDRDGNETFDGNGFGYTWGLEYRFSRQWALGIDLFSLGSASDTFNSVNTTIDVGGMDIRGRIIFPLSENVEMYGRLGFAGYFADVDPGTNNLGEDAVSLGLGLDIDRGEHFTIRLDGRYFDGPRDESGALLTIGFNYRY
ncbi:MAG: outer membrane beta-barrel protein [Woeseiaceae bacterium]